MTTETNSAPVPTFEQATFIKQLEQVPPHGIHEKPDLTSRLIHTGEIPQYDPDGPVLPQGLHLSEAVVRHYRQNGESQPVKAGFTLQPLVEVGRTSEGQHDTRNGTFFGLLNLATDSGETESVPVAVKPIRLFGLDHATQESAMLEYAGQQGLPTLEVVGVCMDHEGAIPTGYVMTRRQPGIQSLNTLDWTKEAANAPTHLGVAAATLSAMHSKLMFHRDLEFKNISSLEAEGSFIVFDMEWAISLKDIVERGDENAVERLSQAIERDFDDVRKSMGTFVYPNLPAGTAATEQERFEYELTHLYEPYHIKLMASGSPHVALLDHAYSIVLERKRQTAIAAEAQNETTS